MVTSNANLEQPLPKHVPFIDEQHYNSTLEWVGLVPLTAAPFSFEMDVVLVGVALFFVMHFVAPSDFSCTCTC